MIGINLIWQERYRKSLINMLTLKWIADGDKKPDAPISAYPRPPVVIPSNAILLEVF